LIDVCCSKLAHPLSCSVQYVVIEYRTVAAIENILHQSIDSFASAISLSVRILFAATKNLLEKLQLFFEKEIVFARVIHDCIDDDDDKHHHHHAPF
jgi:hypothetical protein